MTIALAILAGGVIGWLSSLISRIAGNRGIMLNVVIGVLGAVIAALLMTPLLGGAPAGGSSLNALALLASGIGAIMVLAVVNLLLRGPAN